jgi:hypothetical protein
VSKYEDRPRPSDERGAGGDDMPPSGEEARAEWKETRMPVVWLVLGVAVVALFVILLALRSPYQASPNVTGAGPTRATTNRP